MRLSTSQSWITWCVSSGVLLSLYRSLASNNLTGPIPPELGQLTSLGTLYVLSTKCQSLASACGNVKERLMPTLDQTLQALFICMTVASAIIVNGSKLMISLNSPPSCRRLFGNNLNGSIPTSIASLSKLTTL